MEHREHPWSGVIEPIVAARASKPRAKGLTMVIDKGAGLSDTRDLLDVCGAYIDYVKLAFGTSMLYPADLLREKVAMIRGRGIDVYPGGTLYELAHFLGQPQRFVERALEIGFTCVEVSEGTIEVSPDRRRTLIEMAAGAGLTVITEVGSKDPSVNMTPSEVARQVEADLECGARAVIIEGRDSGKGVGVYDESGAPRIDLVEEILSLVGAPERIMWEAPMPSQQQYWIRLLGPDVNLGNVQVHDVMTVEATRMALRGDTLRRYVKYAARRV